MSLRASYLGMELAIDAHDRDNLSYFDHCSRHDFRLQRCWHCHLLRFPPAPRCPHCARAASNWAPVEPAGSVFSYTLVHQATQAAFKPFVPYALVLVELDVQRSEPLRIPGNVVDGTGALQAGPVPAFSIGDRMRMCFADVGPGLSLPMWTPASLPPPG